MRTFVGFLVLLALAVAGCSSSEDAKDQTSSPSGCTELPEPSSREKLDQVVTIYVTCNDDPGDPNNIEVVAVKRVVPLTDNVLLASLSQLFVGTTPDEAEAGHVSVFSAFTDGQVFDATVRDGTATLTLGRGFTSANNFSTTNLSSYVLRQLSATVFQFPEITGFEVIVDGERWCGFETDCDGAPIPRFARADNSA